MRDSEVVAITVTELSIPTYSSFNVNPNSPATYAPGQNYTFSSTWSDNGAISSVWIEFNGVNYSASQVSGTFSASGFSGVYNFVISDLRPGTYNYIWYARDASGNLNKSVSMNYVVGKATPALSLSLLPSNSVASNTSTNVTGLGCPVQLVCKLYRNGTEVNNSDVARLADGVHNYVYNTTGNENYTSASVSASLYVNSVSTGGGDSDENDDDSSDGRIRTVRDSDMLNGYYVYMNLDDRLKFNLCGMPYYMKLIEIDGSDDEAYFKFTPGTTSFVLGEGDKAEFDLSLNGVNDILFRVEKVESSRVKVYIKRMSDSCGSSAAAPLLIAGGEDFAEKLSFEGSASVLTYTTVSLMTGIFLATLAILISLLSRRRKR